MTYQNESGSKGGVDPEIVQLPYRPSQRGRAVEVFTLASLSARRPHAELVAPQRLDFDLLINCTSGSGVHEVDFEQAELRPGRIVHVRPGQVHRYVLDHSYDAQLVLMQPIQNRRDWKAGPSTLDPDAQTQSDLDSVLSLLNPDRVIPLSTESVDALRTIIVDLLDLRTSAQNDTTLAGRVFADFEQLLGRRKLPPRTVSECAQTLGCSTRTLGRACQELAGSTPKQMIDEAVALEGKRLLSIGGLSATEVGQVLGFSELSHFSRFLRRVIGESPSAFTSGLDSSASTVG